MFPVGSYDDFGDSNTSSQRKEKKESFASKEEQFHMGSKEALNAQSLVPSLEKLYKNILENQQIIENYSMGNNQNVSNGYGMNNNTSAY